jgi:hypothetical protein
MSVAPMTPAEAVAVLWDCRRPDLGGLAYPTLAAIGWAESRLNPHAIGLNDHDPTSAAYLSCDWGWLQINDYWQRLELADCKRMLDPHECARQALAIFAAARPYGSGYRLWSTYVNGRHVPMLSTMRAEARALGIPGVS